MQHPEHFADPERGVANLSFTPVNLRAGAAVAAAAVAAGALAYALAGPLLQRHCVLGFSDGATACEVERHRQARIDRRDGDALFLSTDLPERNVYAAHLPGTAPGTAASAAAGRHLGPLACRVFLPKAQPGGYPSGVPAAARFSPPAWRDAGAVCATHVLIAFARSYNDARAVAAAMAPSVVYDRDAFIMAGELFDVAREAREQNLPARDSVWRGVRMSERALIWATGEVARVMHPDTADNVGATPRRFDVRALRAIARRAAILYPA